MIPGIKQTLTLTCPDMPFVLTWPLSSSRSLLTP